MKLKKILFVHHNSSFVGSSNSLLLLLGSLDRTLYEPSVLITAPKGPIYDKLKSLDIKIHFISNVVTYGHSNPGRPKFWAYPPFRNITKFFKIKDSIRRVKDFLKDKSFDLVYINSSVLWPAAAASKQSGLTTIIHVREQISNIGFLGLRKNWFRKKLEENADQLIVLTNASKEQFIQKDKITVIYNAVDPTIYSPKKYQKEKIKKEFNLLDSKMILFLGGVLPHKGSNVLLQAFSKLKQKYPGVKLLVLGNTKSPYAPVSNLIKKIARFIFLKDAAKNFKKTVAQFGLTNDIVLPGAQSNVEKWIKASDALVFPSTIDHFGRPIVEAIAMHTPAIASDHPSNKELFNIFSDSSLCYLFKNNDPENLSFCLEEVLFGQDQKIDNNYADQQLMKFGFYSQVQAQKIKAVIAKTLQLKHSHEHTLS